MCVPSPIFPLPATLPVQERSSNNWVTIPLIGAILCGGNGMETALWLPEGQDFSTVVRSKAVMKILLHLVKCRPGGGG